MVKTIGRLVDLTGQKFGRLTVKHRTKDRYSSGGHPRVCWCCDCDCGTKDVIVCGQELKKGKTISCGCRWQETKDTAGERFKKTNSKANKFKVDGNITYLYDSNDNEIIIDSDCYDLVKDYCWFLHHTGYVYAREKYSDKHIALHKLIMDDLDNNFIVDHKNGNKSDCRKSNLRYCSREENNSNRKLQKNNRYGVPGIVFHHGVYEVYIGHNKERIYLGSSSNLEEAKQIRIKGTEKYHDEFAFLKSRTVDEYY